MDNDYVALVNAVLRKALVNNEICEARVLAEAQYELDAEPPRDLSDALDDFSATGELAPLMRIAEMTVNEQNIGSLFRLMLVAVLVKNQCMRVFDSLAYVSDKELLGVDERFRRILAPIADLSWHVEQDGMNDSLSDAELINTTNQWSAFEAAVRSRPEALQAS